MVQILKLLEQIGTNYGTINGADKTMIFKYCGARGTYLIISDNVCEKN